MLLNPVAIGLLAAQYPVSLVRTPGVPKLVVVGARSVAVFVVVIVWVVLRRVVDLVFLPKIHGPVSTTTAATPMSSVALSTWPIEPSTASTSNPVRSIVALEVVRYIHISRSSNSRRLPSEGVVPTSPDASTDDPLDNGSFDSRLGDRVALFGLNSREKLHLARVPRLGGGHESF
jgi:hypothetical protein